MNRIFFEVDRKDLYYKLENDRNINRYTNSLYARSTNTKILPRDTLETKFKYNGVEGNAIYTKDTSIKSTPILFDKYGNQEFGKDTLLRDTANRYDVSVSGYKFANNYIKKVPIVSTASDFFIY
jgi:hypothetical protein